MVENNCEFSKINEHIVKILNEDIHSKSIGHSCPRCNSFKKIKYGSYKNGQRYRCKNCGKTFSIRTNSTLYYSKKNPYIWAKFIELMIERYTLKQCAIELNIDIKTAFYWRHKILNSLEKVLKSEKMREYVQIRKIYFKENFKGCKKAPKEKRKLIWVISAKDRARKIIAEPICRERWNQNSFNRIIYSRIDNKAIIEPIGDRYLSIIADKHNKDKEVKKDIEMNLNEYIMNVRDSMRLFRGVASKYLTSYLYWISIYSIRKRFDSISLLKEIVKEKEYLKCNVIKNKQLKIN